MESKTKSMSLLAICMCLMLAHQIGAEEQLVVKEQTRAENQVQGKEQTGEKGQGQLKGIELIKNICKDRGNEELCEKVLKSNPKSVNADLEDLAMISLTVAAEYAKNIVVDAKRMIDDPDLNPSFQQGLADCKVNLLDAESQLQDTIASILSNDKLDAQVWLKAALAAIDTCDDSIPGDDDILSRRSVEFRQLCNIAVAINKAMMGIKPTETKKGRDKQ